MFKLNNPLLLIGVLLLLSGCAPVHFWANQDFPLSVCDGTNKPCKEDVFDSSHDLPTGYYASGIYQNGYHEGVRPKVGIALAGGGSKSAPFAIGALKRFVDEGWIKNVEYISSVSGGGYAALTFYKAAYNIIHDKKNTLQDYFLDSRMECYGGKCSDSLKFFTDDYLKVGGEPYSRTCDSITSYKNPNEVYQERLECYQDILQPIKGGVNDMPRHTAPMSIFESLPIVVVTAASLPFHHLANTVFDWRLNLTPSQWLYQAGIIRTYGFEEEQGELKSAEYYNYFPINDSFTFSQLKELYEDNSGKILNHRLPIWIMNATVPDNETWLQGISSNTPYNFERNIFEISPFHFGSGLYNYVQGSPEIIGLDVYSAVAASAAFLDGTKRDLHPLLLSSLLKAVNFSWGLDVPNYNVTSNERFWHSFLPFPFYLIDGYFADSQNNYIHLADGGQSGDNLGLVALLRRNVENAVIFDGANDNVKGLSYLNELCAANAYLQKNGYEIIFEGHPNQNNNESFILAKECDNNAGKLKIGVDPYNWKWKKAIWQGYVIEKPTHNSLHLGVNAIHEKQKVMKVFYVKSAIDRSEWEFFYKNKLAGKLKNCKSNNTTECECRGVPKDNSNIYCPISSYFLDFDFDYKPDFPQDSTFVSTYNGSANRFKAYRSLGWFLAGQLKELKGTELIKVLSMQ